MKVARIYLRVSTEEQDLTRQTEIVHSTRAEGYYIAGIYREKASGARADRPELLRMIADLQSGEVVVAEKIDRISRLPLAEAEQLVGSIRAKGAKLAVPGLVDLSDFAAEADGVAKIVLESVQELLLKLALQMTRDDYETRRERQRQGVQFAKVAGKYAGRIPDTRVLLLIDKNLQFLFQLRPMRFEPLLGFFHICNLSLNDIPESRCVI